MKHTITQHLKNKSFFLIGIGGSGMMGIAELLHTLGFTVRGSDIQDNNAIKRLRKMKIKIFITGTSGFIGFHTAKKFLDNGFEVIGIDIENDYYDKELKTNKKLLLKLELL